MDGSSNCVVLEALHLQALVDNALSRDRCITMDYDRYDSAPVFLLSTKEMLLSSCSTLDTWIDSLQMRWVGKQSQLDLVT